MEDTHEDRLLVADVMDTQPWIMTPETTVEAALAQFNQQARESFVIVDKTGHILGGLDALPLYAAYHAGRRLACVAELVQKPGLQLVPQTDLQQALTEMQKHQVKSALVVDGKALVGELRLSEIATRLSDILQQKDKHLAELKADRDCAYEYLGLVCHDMRAPLTVVALSADYLSGADSARTLSEDQKSFIERIQRNCESASSMIRDILDVVWLDHGFSLDYQIVRFAEVLDECVQNLQLMASRKNVLLKVSHDQDIMVNLDPSRMRHIIENLVINAIKFSPTGGHVFIRSYLAQRDNGLNLALEVRDQGHGIKNADEGRIFEAFVQKEGRKNNEGLGLGLAIVRKLVDFHQGSIELQGGWQKGATVTIFVPHASPVQAAQPAASVAKGPVILLVDDDESIRELCRLALEDEAYQILEAMDGVEAYALLQKNRVDLVLSDIRMPKMDGLELLAKIRSYDSKVPVILFSGYYVGLEGDLGSSVHKPNRIIDKPFKIPDMVAVVTEQLRRAQQVAS